MFKVRVNDQKEYNLVRWNAAEFNSDLTLIIQSTDLTDVRDTFNSINKIEILQDNLRLGLYTNFDTFAQISYLGRQFLHESNNFVDAMSVTLTKTNLVEQVQRIDEQINPIIDLDAMTIEELREYKLKKISEECKKDICAGETIDLSDGSRQHFSYEIIDQLNYDELWMLVMIAPEIEHLPYHSSNYGMCQFYSREDVITIVSTLMLRKTRLITYCNQLNIYVNSINDRSDLLYVEYGMELPQEYQNKIQEIMSGTLEEVQKFLERILPHEEESDEPGNDNTEEN